MSQLIFFILFIIFWNFVLNFTKSLKQSDQNGEINLNEAKFIIALVAKVAKSDGVISRVEADLISVILDDLTAKFRGSQSDREALKLNFKKYTNSKTSAFRIAFDYKRSCRISQVRALEVMNFLFNLAYVDGILNFSEKQVLVEICDGFEFSEALKAEIFLRFESFFAKDRRRDYQRYGGNYSDYNQKNSEKSRQNYDNSYQNRRNYEQQKSPYEILGVSQNAEFSEIKAKYRELVKKYHPDLLMGKGASQIEIQEATKKLQEINEAYEILKEKFGE